MGHEIIQRGERLCSAIAGRDLATSYDKEADGCRRVAKQVKKAQADLAMRREELEAPTRQAWPPRATPFGQAGVTRRNG